MLLTQIKVNFIVVLHCVPKIPENLRICQNCSSSEEENEFHILFYCNSYKCRRKTFCNDIILKYPDFNALTERDKILFLFYNMDLL